MKNIQHTITKLLLCISCTLFTFACSDDKEQVVIPEEKAAPVLVSTTPTEGTVISSSTSTISLVFDRDVAVVSGFKITLNNQAVKGYEVSGNTIIINIEEMLVNGTEYELSVPRNTLKNASGLVYDEIITLNFETDTPVISDKLVTTNALLQAQKLYDYLLANYGSKIISGAMARVNWNTDEADRVHRWTGKYPALNCFDYVHLYASPDDWIDYSDITVVEDWWNNNGLVAAGWHWNVPVSEGSSDYGFYYTGSNNGEAETSFSVTQAVVDGTYENGIVKADLENIADHLLLLQANNIPVLWRPLHEAAGGWFWWGRDAEAYKKLWILMFDTFKAKGVNNLIWVWTTETGDDNWYPGDAYVDMIGRDLYNATLASDVATQYNSIKEKYPTKMVTLSECGNVAEITDQWTAGAQWSWFMPWYDYNATDDSDNAHATKEFWMNAFASEKVITRDLMPSLK